MNEFGQPARYVIRIRGVLTDTLLDGFEGLHAQAQNKQTVLGGWLPDQAALHGVLAQIEALGLELLEVRQVEPTRDRPDGARTPDPPWRKPRHRS